MPKKAKGGKPEKKTKDGKAKKAAKGAKLKKMIKGGKPQKSELPDTLKRSPKKAQRTFAKAHDSAAKEYGDEERAYRVGFAALKHSFEKVGDHWERKDEPGPSDAQAEGGVDTDRPTAGGVDANASKAHLYELAKKLDVPGRSSMNKDELVEGIQKANDRESRRARS